MTHSITSLDRIKLQARQAAAHYSDVNAACPYPFASPAGAAYRAEFLLARAQIEQALCEADAAEEPSLCICTDQPTLEERDWNRCSSCGKPLSP